MFDLRSAKMSRHPIITALQDHGVNVDRPGAIRCPFHDDKNPSAAIYQAEEGWRFICHGCQWNHGKNSGDVFDLLQITRGLALNEAAAYLGINNDAPHDNGKPPAQAQVVDVNEMVNDAHANLLGDSDTLHHLWVTRAIDQSTAKRFKLGITGDMPRRFWIMPVSDAIVKAHRADTQDQKSYWVPKGGTRNHLFPIHLEPDGPVFLCPGELKALAVAALNLAAMGITSGEGNANKPADLPEETFGLLKGRQVAVIPDDDETGHAWAKHVAAQLKAADIEARTINIGLSKADGLKDVGDWLVAQRVDAKREPGAVANDLIEVWEASDPWTGTSIYDRMTNEQTWTPVTFVQSHIPQLDDALNGGFRTRCVHLICGKPGQAKSQLAVNIAMNAAWKNTPVGYMSLELGADEVTQIVTAIAGNIPRRRLAIDAAFFQDAIMRTAIHHRYAPLTILDDEHWPGGLTRDRLCELALAGIRRFGWRAIVIDYLGLITSHEAEQFQTDLQNAVALRRLARQTDTAVIVVAAVRKKDAKYKGADEITLDDLSGASRLAYDATTVLYVSCESTDSYVGVVHVKPLKLRYAAMNETGIALPWVPSIGSIGNMP